MYLSAHPLDKYYLEITYGCSVPANMFGSEQASEPDKIYTVGGLVVDSKELVSRKGSKFGKMKIEDYSGSAEISLFGDNYINYFKYSSVGNAIRIKYQYQSSRYDKSKTFLTILDVQLLESIKGQVINGIQLNLKERDINDNSLTALLDRYIGNNSEDSRNLFINIENEKEHKCVQLSSTDKIILNKNLLTELEDNEIAYSIKTDNN